MNNNFTSQKVINTAILYAGLQDCDARCVNIIYRDGMYELTIYTLFQRYDFYVDGISGEICGINAEPVLDLEEVYNQVVA